MRHLGISLILLSGVLSMSVLVGVRPASATPPDSGRGENASNKNPKSHGYEHPKSNWNEKGQKGVATVPEPATGLLLLVGAGGGMVARRVIKKRNGRRQ
jgi:hypothetical protein